MKKSQIASILVVGFLIGVCTMFSILILFSLLFGEGEFLPATPELIEKTGSPIAAVILQFFVGGGVGMLFYSLSFIWKHPKLTLKKKLILHNAWLFGLFWVFLGLCIAMHWVPVSPGPLALFVLLYLVFHSIPLLIGYLVSRRETRKINQALQEKYPNKP